jgi:hypothetical protein
LEIHRMATQELMNRPVLHDAVPVGSDFVGGAEALPVRPAGHEPVVPGSDFAGGAVPLTAEAQRSKPGEERAA